MSYVERGDLARERLVGAPAERRCDVGVLKVESIPLIEKRRGFGIDLMACEKDGSI